MAINRHIAATIVRDIARALAVLAIVFLTFAHQPAGASAGLDHDALTAAVTANFCGDAPDDGKPHAPCHACRIGGGADLPPPPFAGIEAPIAVASVTYFGATVRLPTVAEHGSARPRAPPALV